MNEVEFNHIAASVLALWPRSPWPQATEAIARPMLSRLSYPAVSKAVVDIAELGRETAPAPGVIYAQARVIEAELKPRLPEHESTEADWARARSGAGRIRKVIQELADKKRSSTGGRS